MTSQSELLDVRTAKLADVEDLERHASRHRWTMQHELEVIMSRRELAEIERISR